MAYLLDKNKLTNHINDRELKGVLLKCIDIVQHVLNKFEIKTTKFLNPYEIKNLESILKGINGISYHSSGGHHMAERKVMYIYPDYFQEEDIQSEISIVVLKGNFKYKEVNHRDYLGSVLALGITRECIGDILIGRDSVSIIVLDTIRDFIMLNLERISNVRVSKQILDKNVELQFESQEFDEEAISVSSLRIDVIISAVLNISREKAQLLVKGERVRLDYEIFTSSSKQLNESCLISIKGHGRFIYVKSLYETKKGKIKILIKKYGK